MVPTIQHLCRRLAECPEAFLAQPRIRKKGVIRVHAVVHDLVVDHGGSATDAELEPFIGLKAADTNRLRLVLIACWLLHDEWFRSLGQPRRALAWLSHADFDQLSQLVAADMFVNDADRREELARLSMSQFDVLPTGETSAQAADRLKTLNSVERHRVIEAAREKRERAKKLREEMERQRAAEAAARYSRE